MAPNALTASLWLVAAAAMALAVSLWMQKAMPARRLLAALSVAMAVWCFGYGAELGSDTLAQMDFWTAVQYPGIVAIPPLWLLATLRYTRTRRLANPWKVAPVFVVSVLVLVAVWTNRWHHLFYAATSVVREGDYYLQLLVPGPLYFVWLVYAWGVVMLGIAVLVRHLIVARRAFATNLVLLIVSGLVPLLVGIARAMGGSMFGVLDPTPFGFAPTVALLAVLLSRRRMLFLRPIARDMVLDSLEHGLMVVTAEGIITDNNHAMGRIVGRSEDLAGTSVVDLFASAPQLVTAFETEQPTSLEVTLDLQGEPHTYHVSIMAHRNESYELIGRTAMFRDVTDQRKAEEAIRQRDRLLTAEAFAAQRLLTGTDTHRAVNEAITAIGQATDVDRVYVFRNHTADDGAVELSQLYEWVRGGVSQQIDNPELQNLPYSRGYSRWYDLLSRGEPVMGPVEEFPPEEQPLLLEQDIVTLLVVPIQVFGTFWGFMGFDECHRHRDWTEPEIAVLRSTASAIGSAIVRHETAEELRTLNANLNRLVEEKTRALSNAYEELVEFTDSVAHELQGDLQVAREFSRELGEFRRAALDEESRSYVEHIRRAVSSLEEKLKAMRRLHLATSSELLCVPTDLSSIARRVAMDKQASHQRRVVHWSVQPGLTANADPRKIETLFTELLDNAWKFTQPRDPAVIEVGRELTSDGEAFYVRDNGVGYDPLLSDQLFRVFSRLHPPEAFPGRGVGLAIVARIVERHGGRVWAAGQPDQGCTIYFTLPAAPTASRAS